MSRCSDLGLTLYKIYKNRCKELSLRVEEMQRNIDRYRTLLEGDVDHRSLDFHQENGHLNTPLFMTSTPKLKRKLSFSTPDKDCFSEQTSTNDDNASNFEPGSNKWECIADEDRSNYGFFNNVSKEDMDETYYEPEENDLKNKDKDLDETYFEQEENVKNQDEDLDKKYFEPAKVVKDKKFMNEVTTSKRSKSPLPSTELLDNGPAFANNLQFSPGHVCKLPRCPKHQPCFVSSSRKIAKLSPQTKAMATKERLKSPKGYWGLELPSTQFIRSRNQFD